MRRIGVVTVARSDYGIMRPVMEAIAEDPALGLEVYAAAAHLDERHGATAALIEADGFEIAERVPMTEAGDGPGDIAAAIARGVKGFAAAYERRRPDLLMALGDRYEMHSAVLAALPYGIPVAHVHGGEVTEGAIDEALRHAITKMSHLHFPATEEYARRIRQLGEEPWRITVCGAPGLDAIAAVDVLDRPALGERLGFALSDPYVLATYHPVTLEPGRVEKGIAELIEGLRRLDGFDVVVTHPNADAGRDAVLAAWERFAASESRVHLVVSAGTAAYVSLMAHAAAMVGNSSSGIIEAASFGLPVVNVGIRQRGRLRPPNVIDVPDDQEAIEAALREAIAPATARRLQGMHNPYGDGRAAPRIVTVLREVQLGERLMVKRFCDLPEAAA